MLKGVLDKPLLVKILPAMVYGLRYFTMAVEDGPCGWGMTISSNPGGAS